MEILLFSNDIPIFVFKTILVLLYNVGSIDDGSLSNYENNILIFQQFLFRENIII